MTATTSLNKAHESKINLEQVWTSYRKVLHENESRSDLYGSLALAMDYSIHTCGAASFPTSLEPFGQSSLQTDEYRIEGEKEYAARFKAFLSQCEFDYELLDSFLQKYKGLFFVRADKWSSGWDPINKSVPQICFLETFSPGISNKLYEFVKNDHLVKNLTVIDPYLDDRVYKPNPRFRAILLARIGFRYFLENYWPCSHFAEKKCRLCQESFMPQTSTDWIGNCHPDYCSFCLYLAFRSGGTLGTSAANLDILKVLGMTESELRLQLEASIRGFVEFAGFIPPSAFSTKRLLGLAIQEMEASQADECLMWLGILPRVRDVKRFYPSWAHFLDKAGLLTSIPQKGLGGYRSVATDGHLCLSMPERTICEYLYQARIDHEKEPFYPQLGGFSNTAMRADWLIGETYVEFAGMMGVKSYKEKMLKKVDMAANLGLDLIVVEPKDLDQLPRIFEKFKPSFMESQSGAGG